MSLTGMFRRNLVWKILGLTFFERTYSLQLGRNVHKKALKCEFVSLYLPSRTFMTSACCLAGHSHYANTRHIKAAKDGARSNKMQALSRQIEIAIREGGSNDPKKNPRLSTLVQNCKKENMPKATLEKALQAKVMDEYVSRVHGPGGSEVVVVCATTAPHNTKFFIQAAMKKSAFDGKMVVESESELMKKRVIVTTATVDGKTVTEDSATDLAIELGAEDVEVIDVGDAPLLKFICDEFQYGEVEKAIEEGSKGISILSSEFNYIAKHTVDLDDAHTTSVKLFLRAMHNISSKHDSACKVVDVFHNINDDFTTIFQT